MDNLYLNIPSLGADVPEATISDISLKVDGEAVTFATEGTVDLGSQCDAAPVAAPKVQVEKTGDWRLRVQCCPISAGKMRQCSPNC